jgi:hypothetical protein
MYRLIAFKSMKSVIFKTGVAVANGSETMEADTISNHGRSSKSQMSSGNFIIYSQGNRLRIRQTEVER